MAYTNLFGFLISIYISVVRGGSWCYETGDQWDFDADKNFCDQGCCHKSGTIRGQECCGLNTGPIMGIVMGCIAGAVFLITMICYCRYRARQGQVLRGQTTAPTTIVTAGDTTMTTYPTQHVGAPYNPPQQFGQNQPYTQPQPYAQPQTYGQPQQHPYAQPPPQQYGQPQPQQYGQPQPHQYGQPQQYGPPQPQQYGHSQPQQYGQPQPYSQPSAPSMEQQAPPQDQKPQPQQYGQPQPSAPSIEPRVPPLDEKPPSYDSLVN